MRKRQSFIVALALMLLLSLVATACGGGGTEPEPGSTVSEGLTPLPADSPTPSVPAAPTSSPTETPPSASGRTGDEKLAPELKDITGWINSDPFTLESQLGKVVLLDIWTYTCINCIRTLPFLKQWHEKYADQGLVIVGVHSPEFEFEKIRENVVEAVGEFGIEYPVVQDNDFGTWRALNNRFWPAKYLIDKDGYIRYTHFGEGAYDETEEKIRELLAETGTDLSRIFPDTVAGPERDPRAYTANPWDSVTRELYAGYERNYGALQSGGDPPYILHTEFYKDQDSDILYRDPGSHENHFIYLQGLWRNEPERLVHARDTEGYEDYVAIRFYATSVNLVMAPASSGTLVVRLTIDGEPLKAEHAGADVLFEQDGTSFVFVDESRMYRLVDGSEFQSHELKLSSNSQEFSLFAFTFGAYQGGEPES